MSSPPSTFDLPGRTSLLDRLRSALTIPPPDAPVPRWHVAPVIDVLLYHWSWVPPLLVMLAVGNTFPADYWPIYVLVLGMNFTHQALTVRFVYADGPYREAERRRLTVLPLAMLVLYLLEVLEGRTWVPKLSVGPRDFLLAPAALLLFAQLDVALRDERKLPLRWLVPAVVAVVGAALGLASQSGAALGRGPVGLASMAVIALLLAVASASRRSEGEEVATATRVTEVLLPGVLVLLAVGAVAWPTLATPIYPAKKVRFVTLLAPIAVISYVWNFWHVYMQKYGILRLYAAKSGAPEPLRVPGWVDKFFVFAWIPLTFAVVGPANTDFLSKQYKESKAFTEPLMVFLGDNAVTVVSAGVAVVVVAAALFVHYERRATGLASVPRLSGALSFFLLSAALCVFDPIKVVIAFGFNHTLEYIVFVWAWQRRKRASGAGAVPVAEATRGVGRSVYGFALLGVVFWAAIFMYGRYVAVGSKQPALWGHTPKEALLGVATYLSITHFYIDGFLWKIRKPGSQGFQAIDTRT